MDESYESHYSDIENESFSLNKKDKQQADQVPRDDSKMGAPQDN